ncbi:MAG: alpha/beta hydrolase [Caldilinea sp.]|nr:alpha/beta hydrolase [Caldilinea sp.]MDW8439259.1 alpha/beta fold hydrolase [Caldilineaceae bacterium]
MQRVFRRSCCRPQRLCHLTIVILLFTGVVAFIPIEIQAQPSAARFANVYKGWTTTSDGTALDSTLYLNVDGSALLVDDPLVTSDAATYTGQWTAAESGVMLTLAADRNGPLSQPVTLFLDASAGQPLVIQPGATVFDGRGRRYYSIAYLLEHRAALPFHADFAAAAITNGGLAGAYKAFTPGGASGRLDLSLVLFADFRALLKRDELDGRPASLIYGAWQNINGQPLVLLTERDGAALQTPAEITFSVENGVLRGQSTGSSAVSDLVGVPFFRIEGLANAALVLVPPTDTAPMTGALTTTISTTPAPLSTAILTEYEPLFEETPCPDDLKSDASIVCGFLQVPENRSQTDSRSIHIFVTKLAALGEEAPDPLVVMAGAPGDDPGALLAWFTEAPVRKTRSIWILHPRGEGRSEPSLACPEYIAGNDVQLKLQSLADCYNRLLQEGVDLAGYTLDQRAFDVIDLARALKLEQINLLGNDLGAAVAQLVLERRPGLVRSLILESPLPLGVNRTLEGPFGAYDALRRVFADCRRDRACNAAYPDLETRFLAIVARYDQVPASIGFRGDEVARSIFAKLQEGGAEIPALVDALYREDMDAVCKLAPLLDGCPPPAAEAEAEGVIDATQPITPSEHMLFLPAMQVGSPAAQSWRDFFNDPGAAEGAEAELLAWVQERLGFETREELFAFLDDLQVQNFLALLNALGISILSPDEKRHGAELNILCAEDAPRFSLDDLERIRRRLPVEVVTLLTASAEETLLICPLWLTPPAAVGDRIVQVSDAPVLIMAGAYDPVTPARWAQRSAGDFRQPFVRIFAAQGHNLLQEPEGCAQQMLATFIERPTQAPILSCFLRLRPTFSAGES